MSWLTTHILDTSRGLPASGIVVRCEVSRGDHFEELAHGVTDDDGRLRSLFAEETPPLGDYRLIFETADYFAALEVDTFYPRVVIEFCVASGSSHYHVPLLIGPFGYTTYRGS